MELLELLYTCGPPLIAGVYLLVRVTRSETSREDEEPPEPPLPIVGSVRMGRMPEKPDEEDAPGEDDAVPIEYITEEGACSGCGKSLAAESEPEEDVHPEDYQEDPNAPLEFCYHCGAALEAEPPEPAA